MAQITPLVHPPGVRCNAGPSDAASHNSNTKPKPMRIGWTNIPFGIMGSRIVVAIQAFPDTDIEEEKIVVNKEENKRPSFQIAVKMGGWNKSEPSKCRGHYD
uniref:Uncharacterized protein n=1 Tax=Nelumbo nucifera TaxID=4432 RepID=A0A822YSN1_NELNU|nr:TPA_asm: hypothetical protein HUJ06_012638 [Nelumbo nucifera]